MNTFEIGGGKLKIISNYNNTAIKEIVRCIRDYSWYTEDQVSKKICANDELRRKLYGDIIEQIYRFLKKFKMGMDNRYKDKVLELP